jgi:threonylcarbamoyladenosine tRNA methylthiotransferase MtaB
VKIAFLTYGCKANRYETEVIRQALLDGGLSEDDSADVYVINTCTVTGKIDREITRKIKQIKSRGNAKVVLTGCLVERKDLSSTGLAKYADLIIPNSKKFDISSYDIPELKEALKTSGKKVLRQFSGRDKAFVKIQDGCDNFCAYCEVPYVRGSDLRSRGVTEITEEIGALAGAGYREIILTGINLGYYGKDAEKNGALVFLLEELMKSGNPGRLRLSSIGPKETSFELIDLMASSGGKICPHLHLSLQSGDEKVLKSMNRNYTLREYKEKMDYALAKMPYMAITTDVIAGFPGETAEEHRKTCKFIEENGFTRLHVFPYSDRPDTKASKMKEKISEEIKKQRVKELIETGKKKEKEFAERNIGARRTALAESGDKGGYMTGYTENYIRVFFKAGQDMIGTLVPVKIEKFINGKAYGKVL